MSTKRALAQCKTPPTTLLQWCTLRLPCLLLCQRHTPPPAAPSPLLSPPSRWLHYHCLLHSFSPSFLLILLLLLHSSSPSPRLHPSSTVFTLSSPVPPYFPASSWITPKWLPQNSLSFSFIHPLTKCHAPPSGHPPPPPRHELFLWRTVFGKP